MHVLVIGGTRFIGRFICGRLIAHGYEVSVFHRGKWEPPFEQGFRHFHGDRKQLPEFRQKFRAAGISAVIDTMALGSGDADLMGRTFEGLVSRGVVLSSCDVYLAYTGIMKSECLAETPIHEDSPLRAVKYPYRGMRPGLENYDKIDVEEEYAGLDKSKGPGFSIARLPIVYGPHDYQTRTAPVDQWAVNRRSTITVGRGLNWTMHRGYVENVAEGVVSILKHGRTGEAYNLADSTVLSQGEWMDGIRRFFGVNWTVEEVDDSDVPEDAREYCHNPQNLILDTSKVRNECHYREPISPSDGLRITLKWRLANGLK